MASFEARQVEEIKHFVEREGIDCDFEETRVVDVCFYDAGRDKIKSDLASLAKADISTAREVRYYSGDESEKVCALLFHTTYLSAVDNTIHRCQA